MIQNLRQNSPTPQSTITEHTLLSYPVFVNPQFASISLQMIQTIQTTVGHHLKIQVMKNMSVPLRQRQVKVQVKLRLKLRKK